MRYVIGIDGGGTKSVLVILDKLRNNLLQCLGGPLNLNSVPEEEVRKNLEDLILKSIERANLSLQDCMGIGIGTAGGSSEQNRKTITAMIREFGFKNPLWIMDDAVTALVGATGEKKGIILIAGTGSIGIGMNENGQAIRVGGWGHIIGDEGSGYDIGRKILNHTMKAFDGRGEKTILAQLVKNELNVKDETMLIQEIYGEDHYKSKIAGLAKLLTPAVEQNDRVAVRIEGEVVNDLYEHIAAMMKKLDPTDTVQVVFSGSVLTQNQNIRERLIAKLSTDFQNIVFCPIRNNAAWGAAVMALEELERRE